jgi:hypothetical protein
VHSGATIWLINRGHGHYSAAVIALIYLCCSGLMIIMPPEEVRRTCIGVARVRTTKLR